MRLIPLLLNLIYDYTCDLLWRYLSLIISYNVDYTILYCINYVCQSIL